MHVIVSFVNTSRTVFYTLARVKGGECVSIVSCYQLPKKHSNQSFMNLFENFG